VDALSRIRFDGSFVVECMPASPDPFTVADNRAARDELDHYLATTAAAVRTAFAGTQPEAVS
jgi:hypothetical protein